MTVICVMAFKKEAFNWLGNRRAITRAVQTAAAVRGVDEVCIITTELLLASVKYEFGSDLPVAVVGADFLEDEHCIPWLYKSGPLNSSIEKVALLWPTTPLLNQESMESCLEAVDKMNSNLVVAATTRPALALTKVELTDITHAYRATAAESQVKGMLAFRPEFWHSAPLSQLPPAFGGVPVTAIEAVDISEPEGWQIASALVNCGEV